MTLKPHELTLAVIAITFSLLPIGCKSKKTNFGGAKEHQETTQTQPPGPGEPGGPGAPTGPNGPSGSGGPEEVKLGCNYVRLVEMHPHEEPFYELIEDHELTDNDGHITSMRKGAIDNSTYGSKYGNPSYDSSHATSNYDSNHSNSDPNHTNNSYESDHAHPAQGHVGNEPGNTSNNNTTDNKQNPTSCKFECTNLSISSVYESFLSNDIMNDKDLNVHVSEIFKKIFSSMRTTLGKNFDLSIQKWAEDSDLSKVFPINQKHLIFDQWNTREPHKFKSYEQAVIYELGLGNDNHNHPNPNPNPALQLDYLIYNSKTEDEIGIPAEFKTARDYFFNALVRRLRGYRINLRTQSTRTQIGIAKFDVPALEAPVGAYAWKHWGRDACGVDPQMSSYARAITHRDIPLACGISGTTNLALWSLIAYKTDLDEDEMRLFLLSAWSTLCADGGHSLQEVLTQAKLVSVYLTGLLEQEPRSKDRISMTTLNSLESVTKEINPIGHVDKIENQSEHESLMSGTHDKIYNKKYSELNAVEPKNLDKEEKQARNALEYYFSFKGPHETSDSTFGKYYSSFFNKIHNPSFWTERGTSQDQLRSYVNDSCGNQGPHGTREPSSNKVKPSSKAPKLPDHFKTTNLSSEELL